MKTSKKRVLSILLALCMLNSMFVIANASGSTAEVTFDSVVFKKGNSEIFTIQSGELSAELNVKSSASVENAQFITAIYSSDKKMQQVDYIGSVALKEGKNTISSGKLSLSSADGKFLKAMLWDAGFSPLIDEQILSDKSCEKKITDFAVSGATAVDVNTEDRLITVEYAKDYTSSGNYTYPALTNIKPVVSYSGASVSPASESPVTMSLTAPVIYTVTAEDGTTAEYKVVAENTVTRCRAAFNDSSIKIDWGAGAIETSAGTSNKLEQITDPAAEEGSTNKVLHFVDGATNGSAPSFTIKDYGAGSQPAKFSIKFRFRLDSVSDHAWGPDITFGTAKRLTFTKKTSYAAGITPATQYGICLSDYNVTPATDGSDLIYKANYKQWYTIKMVVEKRDNATYSSVYIDDEFVAQTTDIPSSWALQGGQVFRVYNYSSATSEFYLDDYRLTVE